MYRDRQMEKMRNNRVAKLEAKLEANPPMFRGIIVGMPDIISLTSIVEESRNTQIPLAKRTIRYYVTHKVIDKPIRIGRSAYFKRGYILPVMKCITLLRRHFSASLKQIRMVMSTNDDRLDLLNQEIYNFLDRYVARPTYYLYLVDDFIKELTTKIPIDYSKIESTASEKYEKSFIVERSKLPNLS